MRLRHFLVFCMILNLFLCNPPAFAQDTNLSDSTLKTEADTSAIEQAVKNLFTAIKEKNGVAAKGILLNRGVSFQYSDEEKEWIQRVNPELIQWIEKTTDGKYLTYDYSDLNVQFTGPKKNMATATGRLSATWPGDGRMTGVFLMVLIKKKTDWHVQVFNQTDIEYQPGKNDDVEVKKHDIPVSKGTGDAAPRIKKETPLNDSTPK